MSTERVTEQESQPRIPRIWEYTQTANPSSYVALVLTGKRDAFAFQFAVDKGLPIKRLAQRSSKGETREEFSARVGEFIKNWLDSIGSTKYLVVSAGWKKIMTQKFLDFFDPRQIINTHPGPIEKALTGGHKWAGATVQYLVEEADAGEVILRGEIPVESGDTLETLSARVYALEFQIVPQAIDLAIKKLK